MHAQDSAHSRYTRESIWQGGVSVVIQSMGSGFEPCHYLLCDFGQVPSPLCCFLFCKVGKVPAVPALYRTAQAAPYRDAGGNCRIPINPVSLTGRKTEAHSGPRWAQGHSA